MSIRYILFDLDGTLLPMDQDVFIKSYLGHLAAKLAPYGYGAEQLVKAIWGGTDAMVKNDGSRTNEAVFWDAFAAVFGEKAREDIPVFEAFYRAEFQQVRSACGFDPKAAQTVRALREKGYTLVLATNPLFPAIATESRMRWAGLSQDDFALYTTYENSSHAKPDLGYYREILAKLEARPEECLMVGNDVAEDMVAQTLGMEVFLLPACLINRHGADTSVYPQGTLDDLMTFLQKK